MSAEESPVPSAEEMRQDHAEDAATAEYLDRMATPDIITEYAVPTHIGRDRAAQHWRFDGYSNSQLSTVPLRAGVHLREAAEKAQEVLNESDKESGRVVTENLDKYIKEAKDQMPKDIIAKHQRNLELVAMYDKGNTEYKKQYKEAVAEAREYAERHRDVLGDIPEIK